jgi:hypothetical protein
VNCLISRTKHAKNGRHCPQIAQSCFNVYLLEIPFEEEVITLGLDTSILGWNTREYDRVKRFVILPFQAQTVVRKDDGLEGT